MKKLLAISFGIFIAIAAFATTISSPGGGGGGASSSSVTGDPMASYTQTTGATGTSCQASTRIDFNTVLYGDTDSAVTTGAAWAFTVPASKGGVYAVCVSVVGAAGGGAARPKLTLFLNGSAALPITEDLSADTGEMILNGCVYIEVVPTNTIDVRCSSTAAAWTETINAGSWINIYRVRTAI